MFHDSMKNVNQFSKKKKKKKKVSLQTYIFYVKTKVVIKFLEKNFFSAENRLGAEKVI